MGTFQNNWFIRKTVWNPQLPTTDAFHPDIFRSTNPFPNGQPSSLKSGTYPREKILPQYPHFKPPGSIRHEPFRLRQRLSKLPQTSKRTYFGNSPTSGRKYSRHASVTKLRSSQINSSGIGFSPRATSFRGAVPSDQVYGEFDSR